MDMLHKNKYVQHLQSTKELVQPVSNILLHFVELKIYCWSKVANNEEHPGCEK